MSRGRDRSLWGISLVGLLKILAGLTMATLLLFRPDSGYPRAGLMAVHVVAYGAVGVYLTFGGTNDLRARLMGGICLLTGSLFADPLLVGVPGTQDYPFLAPIEAIQVDSFLPFLLWRFVQVFPTESELTRAGSLVRFVSRTALLVGIVLFTANLLALVTDLPGYGSGLSSGLSVLSRHQQTSLYWPLQYLLVIPALCYLAVKGRRGTLEERGRTGLLLWSLVAGTGPMVLWALCWSLFHPVREWLPLERVQWLIYPPFLAMPVALAYAVIVRRALDVRWVIRKALQYALARATVILLVAIPAVWLMWVSYQHRTESIEAVLFTPSALLSLGAVLLGTVLLRSRQGVLDRIDRRFFREAYDARQILAHLIEQCRWAINIPEVVRIVRQGVDQAVHAEADVRLLISDGSNQPDDSAPGFAIDSEIARRLDLLDDTWLDVGPNGAEGSQLPESERQWLAVAGARYLTPLRNREHRLIGALLLGERRGEQEYSKDDWSLLRSVGSAVEMAIGYHQGKQPGSAETNETIGPTRECKACGWLSDQETQHCSECGSPMEEAPLPNLVGGHLRIERRIGRGGMGVVYLGLDLQLGRKVAVKTLPYMSPRESVRLRREARLMAMVSHPSLAQIYGSESWNGRPMLVVEYLAGGSLAQRLTTGPIPLAEVLHLGLAISSALETLHRAGILHRDLKPSNIGFTADGTPKLLDFGLARLFGSEETGSTALPESGPTSGTAVQEASGSVTGSMTGGTTLVGGTLLYSSPEVLLGEQPSVGSDLWALGLVMWEALTGLNPMLGGDPGQTQRRILTRAPLDLRSFRPDATTALVGFFTNALAPSTADRLKNARDFHGALKAACAAEGLVGEFVSQPAPRAH